MKRLGFILALALSCSPPPSTPPKTQGVPPKTVAAPVAPPLTPARQLDQVLPRLSRDGAFAWRERNYKVPGHFSAQLFTTQPERSVIIVTVDDLSQRPQRIAWFKALDSHVGRYRGRSVAPDWIHALVAGRYEVMVRANHQEYRSQGKLAHWFDKLRTSQLSEITTDPKPTKNK